MKPARILFVEDDDTFREVFARELADLGHAITSHATAGAALAHVEKERVDAALLDLRLPDMSGLELLDALHRRAPGLPVVFLTGHGALPDAVRAVRAGAYDFLVKPASLDEVDLALRRALDASRLRRRTELLRNLVDRDATREIVGESSTIHALREAITRIAASDANVLVLGENGTGKELVARAIHEASPRGDATFVVANCGAIPAELFESELFGHRRGAFTGADRKRLGLVELAEGGTLFLDEVGELPLTLQPALLRAVQFGEFRPVGAERTERADVRVVAATNRDLTEAVARGEFREDLYHRLSTLSLVVPPLREREGDLRILALRFLAGENRRLPGAEEKRFSEAALARLESLPWSGNVRELENVVTRLVTLVDGDEITEADVERLARPLGAAHPPGATPGTATGAAEPDATLDLQTLERRAVVEALRRHGGHRERAAAELGVAVKTLYNKLRQHGIAPEEWQA